jgi:PadR family transcriptional regulator AphA
MSLRHAILGILIVEPISGYDLLDYFDSSTGALWPAGQGHIYPELRRMEEDGLLEAKVAPRGKRGEKRIYSVTAQGAAELKRWANEPARYPRERDQVRLRTAYFDLVPLDAVQEYLRLHIAFYRAAIRRDEERRIRVEGRKGALLLRRLATRDPAEHEAIVAFRAFALRGHTLRAKAEIAWAEEGLELVARLRLTTTMPRK